MKAKLFALISLAVLAGSAQAQTWIRSYEEGLSLGKANQWKKAREAFQQAIASRPEDRAQATNLPGPATERKTWRNGAPYSPNFLAAYSLYRDALVSTDSNESTSGLKISASELEALLAKDQKSAETYFFLDVIYAKLGDVSKRQDLSDRVSKLTKKPDFKVDQELLAPEELAALQARPGETVAVTPLPGQTAQPPISGPISSAGVAALPDKFALIIGQSESLISGAKMASAGVDALRVRDALVTSAGYMPSNVDILQNASAAEIKSAAEALSKRVTDAGTVLIYFVGVGANIAGKDYVAGVDAKSVTDTGAMVAKPDLFLPFVKRGARIFSFFEANRKFDANGFYFGMEPTLTGSVSEVQATIGGDTVGTTYVGGQEVGVFSTAFVDSLNKLKSNRIPITDFAWQVVYAMRRGTTGTTGGGSRQVCILPKLLGLASDSKF